MVTVEEFNEMNKNINDLESEFNLDFTTDFSKTMILKCVKEAFEGVIWKIKQDSFYFDPTMCSYCCSDFSEIEYTIEVLMVSHEILKVLIKRLNGMILNELIAIKECKLTSDVVSDKDIYQFKTEFYYKYHNDENENEDEHY